MVNLTLYIFTTIRKERKKEHLYNYYLGQKKIIAAAYEPLPVTTPLDSPRDNIMISFSSS